MADNNNQMVVVGDDICDIDEIGYDEYSSGLVEMIKSVSAKGSFTIGVFGQWGQGKTSMLRQIEKKLLSEESVLSVWFNPWQFTGEEHVIIPFFHTLVSYLEEWIKKKEKKVSSGFIKFLKELAYVPVALAYGMEGEIKIPLLLETKFKFKPKDSIEEARRNKKEAEKKLETEFERMVKEYESMYYRLISKLQGASKELQLKVVVFIDDLDRCLPEKAVELLEGLKVLLDLPGFVFVIAVAREVIEKGIRVRYKELYSDDYKSFIYIENDYLDKIIQFPFTLPPPDPERLKNMIANKLKSLKEAKPYLDTLQKSLGNNPRCLKRCINNLSYTFWVAGKKGDFRPELLIKVTLIAFRFPGLYHVIGRTPLHLIRVQELLNRKEERRKKENTDGREILATGFPEVDDLNLFSPINQNSIKEILLIQEREETDDDKGFADEDEVRQYLSLLKVTTTPEELEKREPKIGDLRNTMESRMVKIPKGKLDMKDEKTGKQFTAEVSSFFIDKYPVTQDLFERVMGVKSNTSHFKGSDRPVESINWYEAVNFCNCLSEEMDLKKVYLIDGERVTPDWTANGYRLPTEAEWEYASRGGTIGETYGVLEKIAWYDENSGESTHGVGKKQPNDWGLYDMLGNVNEWCWDWNGEYPSELKIDYKGAKNGVWRVIRGGSWSNGRASVHSAARGYWYPGSHNDYLGFRLARNLQ